MKKILTALIALVIFSPVAFADMAKPKTFVVVTSGETEVQGMAMILSMQALNNGSDVRILLCGTGGDLALKSKTSASMKPMNKSPRQIMMGLIKKGVIVEVCGLYMPNRDITETDLVGGVKGVKPPVIGKYMADPAVRYFTF